jgi:hypothetical protein
MHDFVTRITLYHILSLLFFISYHVAITSYASNGLLSFIFPKKTRTQNIIKFTLTTFPKYIFNYSKFSNCFLELTTKNSFFRKSHSKLFFDSKLFSNNLNVWIFLQHFQNNQVLKIFSKPTTYLKKKICSTQTFFRNIFRLHNPHFCENALKW